MAATLHGRGDEGRVFSGRPVAVDLVGIGAGSASSGHSVGASPPKCFGETHGSVRVQGKRVGYHQSQDGRQERA